MSGLEIVGVVLGAIPLVISALEHYQHGVQAYQNWRAYKRGLKQTALGLATQHQILQNTCEELLNDIVPSNLIEKMIKDPFGPLWREEYIKEQLQRRLHRSFTVFEQTAKEMEGATDELKSTLGVSQDEELNQKEHGTVGRELKRIALILKLPRLKEILERLSKGNSNLAELLSSNMRLESSRRHRSQGRLLTTLQVIARSIYNALRSSLLCKCAQPHGVNFELFAPPLAVRAEDDDALIRRMDFRLALSYDSNDLKGKRSGTWSWNEIILRMAGPPKASTISTSQLQPNTKENSRVRKVKILTSTGGSSSTTQVQSITPSQEVSVRLSSLPTPTPMSEPLELVDLCRFLANNSDSQNQDYWGYVKDASSEKCRKFDVYTMNSYDESQGWSSVPLKELLKDRSQKLFENVSPRLPKQLNLATVIASSILQLHDTPWMPNTLTSDNVYFIQRGGVVSYDKVYVSQRLPDSKTTPDTQPRTPLARIIKNEALFSLGVLLIELILCEALEDLCPMSAEDDKLQPNPLLTLSVAQNVLYQVEIAGGQEYKEAVDRCLKCDFGPNPSLDDDDFRQGVYSHIIAPLQDCSRISVRLPGERG